MGFWNLEMIGLLWNFEVDVNIGYINYLLGFKKIISFFYFVNLSVGVK